MANKILYLPALLLLLSVGAHSQRPLARHSVTEDMAMDMVMRLPEVKADDAYVRKATKGQRHLFPLIYGEATKEKPYWWVAVGEDNGMSFVTHYGFLVYIRSGKIFYYDTLAGKHIDLRTWRKNGRKS